MENATQIGKEQNHPHKIKYIYIATRVLSVLMLTFSTINFFYTNNYYIAIVEAFIFIVNIYAMYMINKSFEKASLIFTVSLLIIIISICYLTPLGFYGLVWAIIIPINSFFLLDKRKAMLVSGVLFIWLAFFLLYITGDVLHLRVAINLLLAYIVTTAISYMYEKINHDLHTEGKVLSHRLNAKNKMLEYLSTTDALTKLFNRAKIDEIIDYEIIRARRYGEPLSFVLIDIDYFKQVNDTHGHKAGDCILIEFSQLLQEHTRDSDFPSRWGGEEFLVVLPNTSLENAAIFANTFRKNIENNNFSYTFSNTCSIGVSTLRDDDMPNTLLERADRALYVAKDSGRNKVIQEE